MATFAEAVQVFHQYELDQHIDAIEEQKYQDTSVKIPVPLGVHIVWVFHCVMVQHKEEYNGDCDHGQGLNEHISAFLSCTCDQLSLGNGVTTAFFLCHFHVCLLAAFKIVVFVIFIVDVTSVTLEIIESPLEYS